jgi:hypothetical protein
MRNRVVLVIFLILGLYISGCVSEEPETNPFIIMKIGNGLITDGSTVSPGGTMKFGISATGGGGTITNLVVKRNGDGVIVTEMDRGIYITSGGLDTVLTFTRGYATTEKWTFFIMNSYRDTASVSLTVLKGSGSAYGEINYYPSVTLGYQSNTFYPQYLDVNTGVSYTSATVTGNESLIDLVMLWHINNYPTLSCPGYGATQSYYALFSSWTAKNMTTYDYYTSDNNLITTDQFDAAKNDSLLTLGYKPGNVSGFSKYAYTGKVVPFKTSEGKYGLVKIINAGENADGAAEIAVKIQK